MNNKFFLLILPIFFSFIANSRSNDDKIASIHRQIKEINSMPLRKESQIPYLEVGYSETKIYYDSNNRIRKKVHIRSEGGAVDAGASEIEYYDSEGGLIYRFFKNYDTPYPSISGHAYFYDRKLLKGQLVGKYNQTDEQQFRISYDVYVKEIGLFYQELDSFCLKRYNPSDYEKEYYNKRAENFKDYFRWKNMVADVYVFTMDTKESFVNINNNDVTLRKEADVNSEILYRLNPFDEVKIIQKGKEESIGQLGKNYWYKVITSENIGKYEGWVYGAFLEPVELKKE